jgi:hypothetical protein
LILGKIGKTLLPADCHQLYKILRGEIGAQEFISQRPKCGDTMMNCKPAEQPNRVTAIFQHTRLSFDIAREATLAQLAEQLSMLGEIHGGLPLSVDVRVAVERTH